MVVAVQYSTIRDAFQVFQDTATVSTFFLVAKEMPATASSEVDVRDQATGRDAKKKIVAHPAIVLGRMFKKMLEVGFEWLGFNDEAREYIANSVEPWEELILAWAENNSCNNEAKILTDESMTIRKLKEYVVQNSKKIQAQHLELLVNAVLLLIGLREVRAALLALQAAFQLREIGDPVLASAQRKLLGMVIFLCSTTEKSEVKKLQAEFLHLKRLLKSQVFRQSCDVFEAKIANLLRIYRPDNVFTQEWEELFAQMIQMSRLIHSSGGEYPQQLDTQNTNWMGGLLGCCAPEPGVRVY